MKRLSPSKGQADHLSATVSTTGAAPSGILPPKQPLSESKRVPTSFRQTPQEYLDIKQLKDLSPQALYCRLVKEEDIVQWCRPLESTAEQPTHPGTAVGSRKGFTELNTSGSLIGLIDDADEDLSEDVRIANFHREVNSRTTALQTRRVTTWRELYVDGVKQQQEAEAEVEQYSRDLGVIQPVAPFTEQATVERTVQAVSRAPEKCAALFEAATHVYDMERSMYQRVTELKLKVQVDRELARAKQDLKRVKLAGAASDRGTPGTSSNVEKN